MTSLKMNVLMDDDIRNDLKKFIREQARPLVKDILGEVREDGIQNVLRKLLGDRAVTDVLRQEAKQLLMREGSYLRAVVASEVSARLGVSVTDAMRKEVREMIRSEIRAFLGEKAQ